MFMEILLLTILTHIVLLANYTFVSGSNYWETLALIAFRFVFTINLYLNFLFGFIWLKNLFSF